MTHRHVCAGCEAAWGMCNWRGEFFCPACTGALVRLARTLNEIPTASWERVDFGPWALDHERSIVQEWIEA